MLVSDTLKILQEANIPYNNVVLLLPSRHHVQTSVYYRMDKARVRVIVGNDGYASISKAQGIEIQTLFVYMPDAVDQDVLSFCLTRLRGKNLKLFTKQRTDDWTPANFELCSIVNAVRLGNGALEVSDSREYGKII